VVLPDKHIANGV